MSERVVLAAARRRGRADRCEIRPLAYPDLPEVLAIERRVFPDAVVAGDVRARALQADRHLPGGASARRRTARAPASEERLVGYLICSRYDTVWHVMNVAVDLHRQRMGLASRLLAELYARVDDEQARFTLEVRRSNAVAIHLYEREGFRAAGMRRRYYQDNGEDALVMWRTPATRRARSRTCPTPGPV